MEKYIIESIPKIKGQRDYKSKFGNPLPIHTKTLIEEYFKRFSEPSACALSYIYDPIIGKETNILENEYTDGTYIWFESWKYYFKKYDLKLNDDFIQYVLEQAK